MHNNNNNIIMRHRDKGVSERSELTPCIIYACYCIIGKFGGLAVYITRPTQVHVVEREESAVAMSLLGSAKLIMHKPDTKNAQDTENAQDTKNTQDTENAQDTAKNAQDRKCIRYWECTRHREYTRYIRYGEYTIYRECTRHRECTRYIECTKYNKYRNSGK